ncbi:MULTISPECIES: hypothetical protein [unclassified Nocardioides]|uniref:hypothetical protein n=1 Tax=unclassified Nocardioides TaxID=2615069 RepID=UPI0000570DC5|nr:MULTISPECIES: hypothetical protein [unclassified Nocardioides]ABL80609.1 hypothetical protein Noca_1093 [Nocardioides sp. JS614]
MNPVEVVGTDELVRIYLKAKREVLDGGFAHEVAWQFETAQSSVTPRQFVSEASWVVLSAGMREAVVRRLFPRLEDACHGFDLERMAANKPEVRRHCLDVFGHERKIDAILEIAETVRMLGDAGLSKALLDLEPFLRSLPYIGPVTWRHLAKNIGVSVAKADRHMVRFAAATGRNDVDRLCSEISDWIGDPVAVVDVVLWRWSVLHARSAGGSRPSLADARRPAIALG